ncbi:TetR/AcrR family transcriptional regulator [Streptomyces sp. NPDC057099]|uniref:TetR/AcrR family transcriptional regulator n=1 Tax=Streptomyces sp. NPDC057099 TaxID=3346019 RepID=UPI0036423345
MSKSAAVRKPATERRAETLKAADAEFAANGLAGRSLEAIAARVGVSHLRIVQMFGSKRSLFLEVVHAAFAAAESTLIGLCDTCRRLLRSEHTIGLVMLHGYDAAADEAVREAVKRRQLRLQEASTRLTGADAMPARTFFATGLVITVSTLLELPGQQGDAEWAAWILQLAAPPDGAMWDMCGSRPLTATALRGAGAACPAPYG